MEELPSPLLLLGFSKGGAVGNLSEKGMEDFVRFQFWTRKNTVGEIEYILHANGNDPRMLVEQNRTR